MKNTKRIAFPILIAALAVCVLTFLVGHVADSPSPAVARAIDTGRVAPVAPHVVSQNQGGSTFTIDYRYAGIEHGWSYRVTTTLVDKDTGTTVPNVRTVQEFTPASGEGAFDVPINLPSGLSGDFEAVSRAEPVKAIPSIQTVPITNPADLLRKHSGTITPIAPFVGLVSVIAAIVAGVACIGSPTNENDLTSPKEARA